MRRKAFLKPCYCEPGIFHHDDAQLSSNSSLEKVGHAGMESELGRELERELDSATGLKVDHMTSSVSESWMCKMHSSWTQLLVEIWSNKHPRLARCCFARFVDWMNMPPIDPLAKFSFRHAKLALCLSSRFVNYLDTEEPLAPEHFAIPDSWSVCSKQFFAFFLLTLTCSRCFLSDLQFGNRLIFCKAFASLQRKSKRSMNRNI